jgi:hypothetical protein
MKLAPEPFEPTEEHTGICRSMDLADGSEDHVPVGPPKICRRAKSSYGILVRVDIIDHDVVRIVTFDLCGEILLQN